MGITVLKHNVPWGPFTREQVREGLNRGDFTLHYLAHARGLKEWLPLGEVLDYVDKGIVPPPVPHASNLPPVPDAPGLPPASIVASQPPPLPVVAAGFVVPPPLPAPDEPVLVNGPFFIRFLAFAMDCFVLFVPIGFLFGLGAVIIETQGWWEHTDRETLHQEWMLLERNFTRLILTIALVFSWIYAAGLESSRWQATVGKLWMGLKVTDLAGERLTFFRATGRHIAKYLSALPCFLGFIMALFSSRNRALHDRMAGTRVVRS